jgi:hypothetical protein
MYQILVKLQVSNLLILLYLKAGKLYSVIYLLFNSNNALSNQLGESTFYFQDSLLYVISVQFIQDLCCCSTSVSVREL